MMMRSLLFSLPASRVCLAFISHSRSGVLRTDLRRLATTSNDVAEQCLAAKKASGKTFDDLASSLGYTNAYTCQLLLGQAQLKPEKKRALAELLPELSDETLDAMTEAPFRSFDSDILKEPNVCQISLRAAFPRPICRYIVRTRPSHTTAKLSKR